MAAMIFCHVSASGRLRPGSAEDAVNDEGRFFPQRQFEGQEVGVRQDEFEDFDFAVVEKFPGGAGVVAVMAFAGKDENGIVVGSELAGAAGEALADAADDLGFGLAAGPGGLFPFPHGGDVDDRN